MERTIKEAGYEFELTDLVARCHKPTPKAKWANRKLVFAHKFKSNQERDLYVENFLKRKNDALVAKAKSKEEAKIRNASKAKEVQVGDIFVYSFGYDQTNVSFYQVVEKPSSATAIIRPIGYESLETTSWASEYVRPVKDSFVGEKTEKVRLSGNDFKRSCGYATKIENPETSKHYHSWYA